MDWIEKENENLRQKLATAYTRIHQQQDCIACMQTELQRSERATLVAENARLEHKVECLLNQIRVLTAQRNEATTLVQHYRNNAWDDHKPSKAQVAEYYRIASAMMTCENEII